MATNRNSQVIGARANAALTQYRIVSVAADSSVDAATASTANVVGIVQNSPGAGDGARVCVGGVSKLEAGAAVTAGSLIVAVAGGRGSMKILTAGDSYIGVALTGADGSASLFDCMVDVTRGA